MPPIREKGFLGKQIKDCVHDIRKNYMAWFDLAEDLNTQCHRILQNISARNRKMEEVIVAILYLRNLENFQGVIILAERGMMAQSKMLVRCMFDCVFPLYAISSDTQHKYFIDYIRTDEIYRRRFARKYTKLANAKEKFFGDLAEIEKQVTKDIQEKNIKEIKTKEWAQRAGLEDWYNSAYSALSGSIHSSARDLEQYLEINHQKEITQFNWGPSNNGIEKLLMTATQIMVTSAEALNIYFNSENSVALGDFRKRLNELVSNHVE